MKPDANRSLKNAGKELAAQRSAAWQAALSCANPAPVGSDVWMQNYLRARANEKWLAEKQRDLITASDVSARFVLISSEETGTPEPYAECMGCHDLIYTAPSKPVQCSCGALRVVFKKPPRIEASAGVRGVRLIAKGTQ
jgi:hypothetical protein